MKEKPMLAVDFDGTLHKYSKGWQGGKIYDEPMPGAAKAMSLLQAAGYELLIYSVRNYDHLDHHSGEIERNQIPEMTEWLNKHGIPFDGFWTERGKPTAKLFIDDRGYRFHNWQDTVLDVRKLVPIM